MTLWLSASALNFCDIVFTNASREYAYGFLGKLGVSQAILVCATILGTTFLMTVVVFLYLEIFRPRNRIPFFIFFHLYMLFFLAVQTPQILEGYQFFRNTLDLLFPILCPSLVYVMATLLLISLWPQRASGRRRATQILFWAAAAFFLFYANNPFLDWTTSNPQSHLNSGHVLLFGLDGIDPDIFYRMAQNGNYPYSQKYLTGAQVYTDAYTEIPRTAPTLVAILAGVAPHSSDLRATFQDPSRALAAVETSEHIQGWRRRGGKIHLRLSDSAYVNFENANFIDDFKIPSSEIFSLVGPYLVRSPLLFAFFNGFFAGNLLPQVVHNSAFVNTFDIRFFLNDVKQDLAALKSPTLYFSHVKKVHWPGSFPYPYYLLHPKTENAGSRLAYSSTLDQFSAIDDSERPYQNYNFDLYKAGHRLTLDLYVEPLLRYLDLNGFLKNSTVVFFSDHSENFNAGTMPKTSLPGHGFWIPPRDKSNHLTLFVSTPGSKGQVVEEPTAIHSVLPRILGAAQKISSDVKTVETDWWHSLLFEHELWQMKPSPSDLSVSGGLVSMGPEVIRNFLQSDKLRSVTFRHQSFSLVPTDRGFFWILFSKSMTSSAEILEEGWARFRDVYRKDFESGVLPNLEWDRRVGQKAVHLKVAAPSQGRESRIYQAIFDFNNYVNLPNAVTELVQASESSSVDSQMWNLVQGQLLKACAPEWSVILNKLEISAESMLQSVQWDKISGEQNLNRAAQCWAGLSSERKIQVRKSLISGLLNLQSNSLDALNILTMGSASRSQTKEASLDWPIWPDFNISNLEMKSDPLLLTPLEAAYGLQSGYCTFVTQGAPQQNRLNCGENERVQ